MDCFLEEEPEELASDDEDIMNGKTFVCGTTIDANDLFIIITPTHISERDSVTMKERERYYPDRPLYEKSKYSRKTSQPEKFVTSISLIFFYILLSQFDIRLQMEFRRSKVVS